MSHADNPNDPDDLALELPLEEDESALTGAAADSSEFDETLKKLPRLLRYGMLCQRPGSLAHERLIGELSELTPRIPLVQAFDQQNDIATGLALATELDHRAVTDDQPDLRSLADSVRLLCLPGRHVAEHRWHHARVAKALLKANRDLPEVLDVTLAADVESFCFGWAALPLAHDLLSYMNNASAAVCAFAIGERMARHRIYAAEAAMVSRFKEETEEIEEAAARSTTKTDTNATAGDQRDIPVPPDHLVVCRLDETAMKNVKMKEVLPQFKHVINVALPLQPVPPLAEARAKLLFEFPYAANVIDFVLADLVGRQTVHLKPLLIVSNPGVGKSFFCRRLGDVLGLGAFRTDASRSDGSVFGGTDKRWHSAEPCHPLLAIARARRANPMVLIDEIEKAGTRADHGRFWDCLLGFLELETAARYPDPALQTNLDLSQVSYVATANSIDPLCFGME